MDVGAPGAPRATDHMSPIFRDGYDIQNADGTQ
jgi:hypothetical protein